MCVNRFCPNIISRTRWLVKGFFGFFLLFRGKGGRAGVGGGNRLTADGGVVWKKGKAAERCVSGGGVYAKAI